jgi:hypothetical protein
VLVLCEGAKEEIDGKPDAARQGGFQQLQSAVHQGHIAVGRDDVSAVRLDHHSVLHLEDLHLGVTPDQLGENAFVIPSQMLHKNKGHARIVVGGHGGEKSFERRQPSGRRADTHDRESRARLLGWWLYLLWIDCFVRHLRVTRCLGHDPGLLNFPLRQLLVVRQLQSQTG